MTNSWKNLEKIATCIKNGKIGDFLNFEKNFMIYKIFSVNHCQTIKIVEHLRQINYDNVKK